MLEEGRILSTQGEEECLQRGTVYNFSSAQKTSLMVTIHKFAVKAFPKW